MKFIHISDLHLVAHEGPLNGLVPSELLEACLNDIEKWHADAAFCVISGDLAEFGEKEAYDYLKSRLAQFSLPTFLMIGNHDDRTVFQGVFTDHPQDAHGFVQHRHETDAGVFLFLDTKKEGEGEHSGSYCDARLAWLEKELVDVGEKLVYLFMHHPPFEIGIPYVDCIKLEESDAFKAALSRGRNIAHIFYGHVHRLTYVKWYGFSFTSLPSLNHQIPLSPASVAGEYCNEPPAYGVVLVDEGQLSVHFNTFLTRDPLHQT